MDTILLRQLRENSICLCYLNHGALMQEPKRTTKLRCWVKVSRLDPDRSEPKAEVGSDSADFLAWLSALFLSEIVTVKWMNNCAQTLFTP